MTRLLMVLNSRCHDETLISIANMSSVIGKFESRDNQGVFLISNITGRHVVRKTLACS